MQKKKEQDAQLSQRDRAAGCVIVFAKSRRLELGNKICRVRWKKRKIRVIMAFRVIQGHRGPYQSKACMRFPISD